MYSLAISRAFYRLLQILNIILTQQITPILLRMTQRRVNVAIHANPSSPSNRRKFFCPVVLCPQWLLLLQQVEICARLVSSSLGE